MDLKELVNKELNRQLSRSLGDFERIIKSSERSAGARNLGNEIFRDTNHSSLKHNMILDRYNTSVAMAPNDSEELAFAYGNKSALLLHLLKYEDCIKDLDRALKISAASDVLKIKLLCRKVECLVAVGRVQGRRETLEEAKRLLIAVDCAAKVKEELVKIVDKAVALMDRGTAMVLSEDPKSTEHLRILARTESSGIFHNVNLSYNTKLGHHLVATKNFAPGEIIFVSKPYAAVANLKTFYKYCGHCVNYLWSSVPCDNCCISLYCSEKCRDEAKASYHDIECPCLQFLSSEDGLTDYQPNLALRSIIRAVKEFGSVKDVVEVVKEIDSQPDDKKGFFNDAQFDHQSFRSLFRIRSNRDLSVEFMKYLVERACRIVIVLAKCTTFFGDYGGTENLKNLMDNEDVVFIATLLVRLSKIIFLEGNPCKEGTTYCKNNKDQITCSTSASCCERGKYIDTMYKLFPHSCNPNVRSVQIEGGKELWYTLQPITKGQVLFDTHKSYFFELEKSVRVQHLIPFINRICDCIACANDWPVVLKRNGVLLSAEEFPLILSEAMSNFRIRQNLSMKIGEYEEYTQTTISDLSKIMSAMFKATTQPSQPLCVFIAILRFVFDRLHGIKLHMPSSCRNVIP